MKKSMKKFMIACAAVSAMAVAAGMSAMAADISTSYDAENNSIPINVPAAAAADTQKTVLVVPTDKKSAVTDADILYINQDTALSTALLKGESLENGTYSVLVGYYEGDTFKIYEDTFKIGNDDPTPEFLLGDVNEDTDVDSQDALLVLDYEVGNVDFTDTQKLAADVNKDSDYDSQDALMIMDYEVGAIDW